VRGREQERLRTAKGETTGGRRRDKGMREREGGQLKGRCEGEEKERSEKEQWRAAKRKRQVQRGEFCTAVQKLTLPF
jgi:hypothetical protein